MVALVQPVRTKLPDSHRIFLATTAASYQRCSAARLKSMTGT
jgi:hypothetical protein